jgi:anti-sigma-K factor RskA
MSAETRDHREWLESAALFALDALDGDERRAFGAHAATCDECRREVASLRAVGTALAYAVPQVDPPPALRTRVLAAALGSASVDGARPESATHHAPGRSWLPLAAALLLAVGLGAYAYSLRTQLASLESALNTAREDALSSLEQAQTARQAAAAAQQRLDVLMAADSARVQLSAAAPAPASGRADWSRTRGLLVSIDNLPPAPAGRTYQVWYLTRGMPVSAGLLRPDASGRLTGLYPVAPGAPDPIGFALTEEIEGGAPQPTTQPVLVGLMASAPPAPPR